jgi:3' exoribonuclease family, domain 1
MEARKYTTMLGDKLLTLETGRMAKLVSGSVLLTYGETMLLATAQSADRESTLDFLPLTVEFEERHYAVGKIPGSFMRRESRPGKRAILSSRITDRQIRPLFPKNFRRETQGAERRSAEHARCPRANRGERGAFDQRYSLGRTLRHGARRTGRRAVRGQPNPAAGRRIRPRDCGRRNQRRRADG